MKCSKKIVSLILCVCMLLSVAVVANADTISTNGGAGTTPVSLTTTNDGLGDNGDGTGTTPAATALSVTVPTALPMAMAQDGTVTTATNCRITNNSYGAVRVRSATITAAEDWSLTAYGDKATLAAEKVDSNKLGFALTIGGGAQKVTDSSNAAIQALFSSAIPGCYMTGVGNSNANFVSVIYDAIVTPLSSPVTAATIANVVFVVEWDTAA